MDVDREEVLDCARRARVAAGSLRQLTRQQKDHALRVMADYLVAATDSIVEANAIDVARATADGISPAIIDRLTLTPSRIADIADALREVAELPDPIGEVIRGYTVPNGLEIRQIRVPLGVVGMIYEARPNVTVDAAGLSLKSGNAALLRGSSSADSSNRALVNVMRSALVSVGIVEDAVQLVPGVTHESVKFLMTARGLVDVLIPRGGEGLIRTVVEGSTVPVIETGVGNCHVYVDADADIDKAIRILINSKAQRVSVCNAAETLLVHRDIAAAFLPVAMAAMGEAGITVHGDAAMMSAAQAAGVPNAAATDEDWAAEYYSLDIAARVVDSLDEALAHIARWSSGHTEAIITEDPAAVARWFNEIDSAVLLHNASTQFSDGGEFGFGGEIGIATGKFHARGPVGVDQLCSFKYLIEGTGQTRP